MAKKRYELEDVSWSCRVKIEDALNKMDGVESANVTSPTNKVTATFNEETISENELEACLEKLGYHIVEKH